jgi:hypothetical protein
MVDNFASAERILGSCSASHLKKSSPRTASWHLSPLGREGGIDFGELCVKSSEGHGLITSKIASSTCPFLIQSTSNPRRPP